MATYRIIYESRDKEYRDTDKGSTDYVNTHGLTWWEDFKNDIRASSIQTPIGSPNYCEPLAWKIYLEKDGVIIDSVNNY